VILLSIVRMNCFSYVQTGSVLVAKLLLALSLSVMLFACSKEEAPIQSQLGKILGDQPIFSSLSKDAVLLRYKHKVGQRREGHVEFVMTTTSDIGQGQRKQSIKMLVEMHVRYLVKAVAANGDSDIEMKIIKISAKSKGVKSLDYDSDRDKAKDKPEFGLFKVLILTPIDLKVNNRGKVLSMSIAQIEKKVKKLGNKIVLAHLKRTTHDLTNSAFVVLPENKVKIGDEIEAGVIKSAIPNVGTMNMVTKYKVLAISSDNKKVILQPLISYNIESKRQSIVKMDIVSTKLQAWILFGIDEGDVLKSSAVVDMKIVANTQGTKVFTTVHSVVRYVNKISN